MENRRRTRKNSQENMEKLEQTVTQWADKAVVLWGRIRKNKKAFMAVPVAVIAILMAVINLFALPALVGFGMEATGEFSFEIIREVAVIAPLAITAICLLLMYVSKRTLTPCMVSWFSLLLPLMILLTNTFPA